MGKGTIVSGGVAGSYQISLDYGKATQTAKLAALAARLAELVGLLADALGNLNTQEIIDAPLLVAVEDAVTAYVAATEATRAKALANHSAALIKHTEALRKRAPLRLAWQLLKDEQAQALKDQIYWQNLVLEETVQAWCADYTEDATGFVATVEIPGESKRVLIAPAAPAPVAANGELAAREVQSPAQVFLNAAILPGWQKHKPTYRRGTITGINTDADTASVTLEVADTSSAQGLNINQAATLTAVPVKYMTCNAAAFEVGDKCVVMFKTQDWAQPEIIGFVDNPKPCELILSGVVKGGTLSDLPIPPGSPPGTLAKKTLNTFKPTANCWQYPLKSAADKSPSAFSAEPLLGKAGTQYVDLAASMFTGLMAKAVQIIMGMGLPVAYDYTWAKCHGLTLASDGKPWLIEISIANGVLAMPFKLATGSPTNPVDAVTACKALLGGIPANTTFPTGAALTAAIAAGAVLQLLDTAAMAPAHGKSAYSASMGWSFNAAGSEAHNTCHYVSDGGQRMSCHYKLNITAGPGASAALSLVAEGRLVKRATSYYAAVFRTVAGDMFSPFLFDGGVTGLPRDTVDGNTISADISTTVFVCHVGNQLHKVGVHVYAFDAARDPFVQPHLSTLWADQLENTTDLGVTFDTVATGSARNDFTAVAYGASAAGTRDAYVLHKQTKISFDSDYFIDMPGKLYAVVPSGIQSTTPVFVMPASLPTLLGYRLLGEVARSFTARCGMFGTGGHEVYTIDIGSAQYAGGLQKAGVNGALLAGEDNPPTAVYNFIGYL